MMNQTCQVRQPLLQKKRTNSLFGWTSAAKPARLHLGARRCRKHRRTPLLRRAAGDPAGEGGLHPARQHPHLCLLGGHPPLRRDPLHQRLPGLRPRHLFAFRVVNNCAVFRDCRYLLVEAPLVPLVYITAGSTLVATRRWSFLRAMQGVEEDRAIYDGLWHAAAAAEPAIVNELEAWRRQASPHVCPAPGRSCTWALNGAAGIVSNGL